MSLFDSRPTSHLVRVINRILPQTIRRRPPVTIYHRDPSACKFGSADSTVSS